MLAKRIRWSLLILASLCLVFGLTTERLSQRACATEASPKAVRDAKKKKPILEQSMETINQSYRLLRRQVSDQTKNQATIELLKKMQTSALMAATQAPPMAKKLPREKQGKFLLAYKRTMIELVTALLDIEAALLDADNTKAKQLFPKLSALKKKGHEMFKEEEH